MFSYVGKSRSPQALFAAGVLWLLSSLAYAGPMDVGGQVAVGPSGGASYSIPLQVPPGVGGIEPKLALSYSSQGGNGLLGVGWSLSGLSAITRCPRTLAQDGVRGSINLDANDRYCLDGQRLIAVTGTYGAANTEYRTELESYSKIIGYGGSTGDNTYFKVWTKSGQIIEYGDSGSDTDTRIEFQGKTKARVWAIKKISDTVGNYMTFSYNEDNTNGDYTPSRIDYTGNTGNTSAGTNSYIIFVYETRPDITPQYFAGSLIKGLQRLSAIRAYINPSSPVKVKEYQLAYGVSGTTGRSGVVSLKECDGATTPVCKPAVNLGWQAGPATMFPAALSWTGALDMIGSQLLMGDFNGDGRTDILIFNPLNRWHLIYLANNDGSFLSTASWSSSGPAATTGYTAKVGDFNGDGKSDIYLFNSSTGDHRVWLNSGDGTFPASYAWASGSNFGNDHTVQLADLNGDGKIDIYLSNTSQGSHKVWLNNGDGTFPASFTWQTVNYGVSYTAQVADFNGDGKADIYLFAPSNGAHAVRLNNGDGTFAATDVWATGTGFGTGYSVQLGDFNGDGMMDIYLFDPVTGVHAVWLNQGNGTFPASYAWTSSAGYGAHASTGDYQALLGDFNGDGKTDIYLYIPNPGTQNVWLNKGDGTFPTTYAWSGSTTAAKYPSVQLGDFNGDGKTDLYLYGFGYYAGGIYWVPGSQAVWAMNGPIADLLTTVNSGLGTSASFTYKPLTDSTVYTKDTVGSYPVINLQFPLYVVSQLTSSNGVGGTLTTNYKYGALKADMTGRGLLGFGWMSSTSANTNVTVRTDFLQTWPYIGQPSVITKTLPAAAESLDRLSQVTNTFACLDPSASTVTACTVAAGKRYFPYASTSVESTWDLNGVAFSVVTTTNAFDIYGNATQVKVSTPNGYSKTTTNTYANDTTNSKWFLGRLMKSTVTSVTP